MIQNFKQYNESLRDKMSPVSEDDIRKKMGEEKYHIYKTVQDAKDSIKEPFEITDERTSRLTDDESYKYIDAKIWFLKFLIKYDGDKWSYTTQYNQEEVKIEYKYWIEIYHQMISDINKFFGEEIETIQININRDKSKIDNLKDELEKVNSLL